MIERLYDLDSGEIRLEKNNLQALSVPWLRSRLGLVSQVGPLSSLLSPLSSVLLWVPQLIIVRSLSSLTGPSLRTSNTGTTGRR